MTLGTPTQLFLGTAATLIASSTAFVAPMAVRTVAPAASSSGLKMQSAGSAYVETLPGAPFSDGKVSTVSLHMTSGGIRLETSQRSNYLTAGI